MAWGTGLSLWLQCGVWSAERVGGDVGRADLRNVVCVLRATGSRFWSRCVSTGLGSVPLLFMCFHGNVR